MFIKIEEISENIESHVNTDNADNNVNNEDYKTVSDVLVEQMVAWGIKYVFGLLGTSSLGIIDVVRKNDGIEYFQVRHEQTAAMMASAYGKITGNIAACLTIAGPGATNLATGFYMMQNLINLQYLLLQAMLRGNSSEQKHFKK